MHNTVAENLSTDIKAAISALNNNPLAMRKVYREINKVLWETFSTQIIFVTPGCSTSESVKMENAYTEVAKKIKFEFGQAYKYDKWNHLNEETFLRAIDRLLYNIHYSLTFESPKEVYIYRSQQGSNSLSSYMTRWAGEARYGLYVKVVQIDGSAEEFDLLETYSTLEKN